MTISQSANRRLAARPRDAAPSAYKIITDSTGFAMFDDASRVAILDALAKMTAVAIEKTDDTKGKINVVPGDQGSGKGNARDVVVIAAQQGCNVFAPAAFKPGSPAPLLYMKQTTPTMPAPGYAMLLTAAHVSAKPVIPISSLPKALQHKPGDKSASGTGDLAEYEYPAGGALAGAVLGFLLGGPPGALVGAALGGGTGYYYKPKA
jgi:hypothetical protein